MQAWISNNSGFQNKNDYMNEHKSNLTRFNINTVEN